MFGNSTDYKFYLAKIVIVLSLFIAGCAYQTYEAVPVNVEQGYQYLSQRSFDESGFQKFLQTNNLKNIEQSSLDYLICAMLYFNQDIDVLIKQQSVALSDEKIANTTRNPNFQIPFGYNTVINEDRSPWLLGFVVNLFYEKRSKREARVQLAEVRSEIARLNILKTAWDLKQQLSEFYWQYYLNLSHIKLIEQEIEIKEEIIKLLETRKEYGEANSFEISSARIELQAEIFEKSQYQLNKTEAYYNLLNVLDVTEIAFAEQEGELDNIQPPENNIDFNQQTLQNIALHKRSDLLLALLEYQVKETQLLIAIENQYPDITLSPGFVFDQSDNVWSLGASWVLPLLKNQQPKIEKSIKQRSLQQSVVLEIQAAILNQLNRQGVISTHRKAALNNLQNIILEFDERFEILTQEYKLGAVDQLEYLRSKLEKINLQQSKLDMEVGNILSDIIIERTVEYPLSHTFKLEDVLNTLVILNNEVESNE